MRRLLLSLLLMGAAATMAVAQRVTDHLDRGLVAMRTNRGIMCTWRITADEYYDVTYNIYRNGTKLNSEPLTVSNYLDQLGNTASQYSVEAVVRGVPQGQSESVTPWADFYKEIKMDHGSLTSTYVPNDACCADVDGDGEVEILLKFDNQSDANMGYLPGGYNREYAIIEVYKLDGTKLWWIDLGPNMTDFQNNENNIVAYDWDGDGKAEAVLRVSDSTVVHPAVGEPYVIGDPTVNARPAGPSTQSNFFVNAGGEYLLYLNGATGEAYQIMDYPLPRFDEGEYNNSLDYGTNLSNLWGDGYGHRSTKHFFGAPYLDGRKPSIFLARGIYTRHKMVAYDVNPETHQLTERWRWKCYDSASPWYGQGYHNYCIADVDLDGRDEVCFGSMVIDDNGRGLSTSGLYHGDAMHVSDFDPYTPGLEFFGCNESRPGNNLRNATTSEIYYRSTSTEDDGRAVMGNFMDNVPGAVGVSANDPNVVGAVARTGVMARSATGMSQNFRIYWDGDLCEEMFDSRNGRNTNGRISRADGSVVQDLTGSLTNNDTKSTPCYQGDILGDWREEVIMRTADNNIRIYSTNLTTTWRVYSLWDDHQYRQAMVWQMCGYNQPPHLSYYLGRMEGITTPPPPLTMTGRTEIANGATISASHNNQHIMMCETGDMTVSVADGASPYILTVNAPSWVQGNDDNNNIDTTLYTHTITGGAFTGDMRLVKQGDGVLQLPNVTQAYTGPTNVWAGTLSFDGTMQNSRVWLGRHTTLVSNGGHFGAGIEAEYNAAIVPGGEHQMGTITTDSLILNFGATLVVDLFNDNFQADQINAQVLKIGTVDWTYGPKHSAPVLRLVCNDDSRHVPDGQYTIGHIDAIDGSLDQIEIEGLRGQRGTLACADGVLTITIESYGANDVTWLGSEGTAWDLEETHNFAIDATGEQRAFVNGDRVTINDQALSTQIVVGPGVAPESVTVDNYEKNFTLSGNGFEGSPTLTKSGTASLTINSANSLSSATINAGTVNVSLLASGDELGALGSATTPIAINGGATLGITATTATEQPITVGDGGATLSIASGATLTLNGTTSGDDGTQTTLAKTGAGALTLGNVGSIERLTINQGIVNTTANNGLSQTPTEVEMVAGQLWDYSTANDSTAATITNAANITVGSGNSGSLYAGGNTRYTGKLSGEGRFVAYAGGMGTSFEGDWSQFAGTLVATSYQRGNTTPHFAYNNSHSLANATLEVMAGTTFDNCGNDVELGDVTLSGALAGSGTYIVGNANRDVTLRGTVASPIRKIGTGQWQVQNNMGYDSLGIVAVEGGTLYLRALSAPSTSMMGKHSVTMASGTTIAGIGTVQTLIVNSGATVAPGTPTSTDPYGAIATVGDMDIAQGATVSMNIRNARNASSSRTWLRTTGKLTINGTIDIALSSSYEPAPGDSIVLWQAAEFAGTPTINLPSLPTGLYWVADQLLTANGSLRVGGTIDGIDGTIANHEAVSCQLYTVGGVMVASYASTKANAATQAQSMALAPGTYVLRMASQGATESTKVVVKGN